MGTKIRELSIAEREHIILLFKQNHSIREIDKIVKKSFSTTNRPRSQRKKILESRNERTISNEVKKDARISAKKYNTCEKYIWKESAS